MAASQMPVNHLSCSLCLDTLKNPKLLPCHHTFCEACLLGLVDNAGNNYLHCPQCRKRMKLSKDGIRRLQTNFYLTPLLEQQQDVCGVHPGEELRFVCVPCDKAICCTCLLLHHNQHELQDFGKAVINAKAKLKKYQDLLDDCRAQVTAQKDEVKSFRLSAEEEMKNIENRLRQRAKSIHAIVDGLVEKHLLSMKTKQYSLITVEQSVEYKLNCIQDLQNRLKQAAEGHMSYEDITRLLEEWQDGLENELEQKTKLLVFEHTWPVLRYDHESLRGEPVRQLLGDIDFVQQACEPSPAGSSA